MEKEMKDETLPPGFRFHPTDEELITCYLINKISDANFAARAVTDVDLNKCEPWDLPGKAKMGEKEWYFFSLRDRKYPTGVRTNRATNTGYWKTTGKDKEIFNSSTSELVGMKKTLVFYRGRAPRGEKTNWVMHEYRLHSKSSFRTTKQDEWVVCRVFQKSAGAKKYPSSSNQSRALNPYNVDMLAANNAMHSSQMLQSSDQNIAFQHQFPMGMGRPNYLSNAEFAELNRVYRSSAGSTGINNNNNNNIPPISVQMQSQLMNYPQFLGAGGNGSGSGNSFTISGLNLNLGGGSGGAGGASSSMPPFYRPPAVPQAPQAAINVQQVDHVSGGNSLSSHDQAAGNYGVDMSQGNVGINNRFMTMEQADLENYWAPY
ncbi:hypothetical protein DCAR_0100483 [Daucus carota subsp. sativus]|uniref:NAC domain-containing protein n=1 Tax=Daucus carota subsp. sativus TaxID=79200 RepID=A0A162AZE8_DAUCS|nr:PREDICTED: NAC domain-containing protein 59-like [Daucus carota subsp. sativus]WOG81337.1 hypothetical protein DCAR_0100483 [Daucus carota subsp. sativus]